MASDTFSRTPGATPDTSLNVDDPSHKQASSISNQFHQEGTTSDQQVLAQGNDFAETNNFAIEAQASRQPPTSPASTDGENLNSGDGRGMLDSRRDKQLPDVKQASLLGNSDVHATSPPSRLLIPKKYSPSSSRKSSISDGTSSPSRSVVFLGSQGSSLSESLEAALGERTGPGRRVLTSASSGSSGRAAGSPNKSMPSRRARRDERYKGMLAAGARGFAAGHRSSLSNGTTPRTSQSPEAKRNSVPFADFVTASNAEISFMDSSRLSVSGKRPRDRNALRVAVRVRPLIAREKGSRSVTCETGGGQMVVINPKKFKASADAVVATASAVSRANMATSDWLRPFDFDQVFWSAPGENRKAKGQEASAKSTATQRSVYEGLGERIVEDVLNGYNCSCFAYGHTGSGKTYSMFGFNDDADLPGEDKSLDDPPEGEAYGLVPRLCYHLLRRLREGNAGIPHAPGASSVGLSVQFIEIYNDKIRDLLHPGADSSAFRVREHPQTGPYVDNLVPVQVESWSQLRQLLVLGSSARTEADTRENSKSSRGHAILTLELYTSAGLSRVQMVDLAGSEREVASVKGRHGSAERSAGGGRTLSHRLRETAQIKKALSNLGIIIKGLSKGDTPVGLPFRDSILTWLLKEALSGRAHTTMLATVSPSSHNYVETMNTLKYAERLRRASAHLYWDKDTGGTRIEKPSDGMKKEMAGLVEKLGADGIEAKRQVLYQTVSDPQQRIAKLTAKDPRRRRTSSGGSSLPIGDSRFSAPGSAEQRRTSCPPNPSPGRFGSDPATPSSGGDNPRMTDHDGTAGWGSPIFDPGDLSSDSAMADGGGVEEAKGAHAVHGAEDEYPESRGGDESLPDTDNRRTDADNGDAENADAEERDDPADGDADSADGDDAFGPEAAELGCFAESPSRLARTGFVEEPDSDVKLYSDSESDSDVNGGGGGENSGQRGGEDEGQSDEGQHQDKGQRQDEGTSETVVDPDAGALRSEHMIGNRSESMDGREELESEAEPVDAIAGEPESHVNDDFDAGDRAEGGDLHVHVHVDVGLREGSGPMPTATRETEHGGGGLPVHQPANRSADGEAEVTIPLNTNHEAGETALRSELKRTWSKSPVGGSAPDWARSTSSEDVGSSGSPAAEAGLDEESSSSHISSSAADETGARFSRPSVRVRAPRSESDVVDGNVDSELLGSGGEFLGSPPQGSEALTEADDSAFRTTTNGVDISGTDSSSGPSLSPDENSQGQINFRLDGVGTGAQRGEAVGSAGVCDPCGADVGVKSGSNDAGEDEGGSSTSAALDGQGRRREDYSADSRLRAGKPENVGDSSPPVGGADSILASSFLGSGGGMPEGEDTSQRDTVIRVASRHARRDQVDPQGEEETGQSAPRESFGRGSDDRREDSHDDDVNARRYLSNPNSHLEHVQSKPPEMGVLDDSNLSASDVDASSTSGAGLPERAPQGEAGGLEEKIALPDAAALRPITMPRKDSSTERDSLQVEETGHFSSTPSEIARASDDEGYEEYAWSTSASHEGGRRRENHEGSTGSASMDRADASVSSAPSMGATCVEAEDTTVGSSTPQRKIRSDGDSYSHDDTRHRNSLSRRSDAQGDCAVRADVQGAGHDDGLHHDGRLECMTAGESRQNDGDRYGQDALANAESDEEASRHEGDIVDSRSTPFTPLQLDEASAASAGGGASGATITAIDSGQASTRIAGERRESSQHEDVARRGSSLRQRVTRGKEGGTNATILDASHQTGSREDGDASGDRRSNRKVNDDGLRRDDGREDNTSPVDSGVTGDVGALENDDSEKGALISGPGRADEPASLAETAREAGTSTRASSKRITWGEDEHFRPEDDNDDGRTSRQELVQRESKAGSASPQQGSARGSSSSQGVDTGPIARREGSSRLNQSPGYLPNDSDVDDGHETEDSRFSALHGTGLYSSMDSGGGAAALAASGVFDLTCTSGEEDVGGGSVDDADSLDALGIEEEEWTPMRCPAREEALLKSEEGDAKGSSDAVLTDDSQRLIEDLLRQIKELKEANAELMEEVRRVREEQQRNQESLQEAWAIGDDVARECKSRLAAMQRALDEQTDRAREAEREAREADARAENVLANVGDDGKRRVDDDRQRAQEADERTAAVEAREEEMTARDTTVRQELAALQDDLDKEIARADEAEKKAQQSREALEAFGGSVDAAIVAAQRAAEDEREKAAQAEVRANRATAQAKELAALVGEHEERLAKARKTLEAEGARAHGAEVRERRAIGRADDLAGTLSECEKRLLRATEARGAESSKTAEAAEGRRIAEYRVRELEREAERQVEAAEGAKREAEAALATARASTDAEVENSAARLKAAMDERDRLLEQVEGERTEVLRLSAELDDVRSGAQEDAEAAKSREEALQALVASENEASRAEQAVVEELLTLISSAQQTDGDDSGTSESPAVSVAEARFAVEAQQAKHKAARRLLKALEDENRALRQKEAEGQVMADRVPLLEEERDFLLKEKENLVGRLGGLEARQRMLYEREEEAGNREGEADIERERVEQDLRVTKKQLSEEIELRAKDAEEHANRVKERDERNTEQLQSTIKQVMEGVRSQAGHIRETVARLEGEKDETIGERDAAKKELEELKSKFQELQETKDKDEKGFEEQMKQSARERAALWLAVNKLDVLEAAKDAAIKELQSEGDNKSRALKVLQAHNAGLTRELGSVDMSLMQALEDNGLTLDSIKLQNTPISRRISRRRRASYQHAPGNSRTEPAREGNITPPTIDAQDLPPSRTRFVRPSATGFHNSGDESALERPSNGVRLVVAQAPGRRGDTPPRTRSRKHPVTVDADAIRHVEDVSTGRAYRARTNEVEAVSRESDGQGSESGSIHADRKEASVGLPPSLKVDRWDPAINTIEREIEQLSERLNGQPHPAAVAPSQRRISSHADLSGEDLPLARHHGGSKKADVVSGLVGKRLRVRGDSEVSPTRTPISQRPRRERGNLIA